jgi:DNA-nicking Smr family endonuclease
MKAPPPPRPTHRPPRSLTEDERKLWEKVMHAAKPLKAKQRRHKEAKSAPATETSAAAAKAATITSGEITPKKPRAAPARASSSPPPSPTPRQPSPLTRKERSRIARGRDSIAARLDLHGMTQTQAHRALHRFVCGVHDKGGGVILVITGKGRAASPDSERGVLRRQVPHWLASAEFRDLVSGFESAHIGHGGDGALYVRVRRSRATP